MNSSEVTRCSSPDETRAHAAAFAKNLQKPSVIRLTGDLGAGKTEWVKGLAAGLGSKETVTSPTFSLQHQYEEGRFPVYHWDLYRLEADTDWSVLDLETHLPGDGITVIEWPERYPGPWPKNTFDVKILLGEETIRSIQISVT